MNSPARMALLFTLGLLTAQLAAAQQDEQGTIPGAPDGEMPQAYDRAEDGGVTLDLKPGEGNGNSAPAPETATMRDPFWPVGFTPKPPEAKSPDGTVTPGVTTIVEPVIEEPPKWDEALKLLSVKGVMKGKTGGFMAAINNQVVSEGDVISAVHKNRKYSWKVSSISDKGVSFARLNVVSQ